MKKNEKIRRASKVVLIYKYCEEVKFNLITLKNDHSNQKKEESFRAALHSLDQLFMVAKPKLLAKTNKFYCVKCKKIVQHKIYHYTSRPLGLWSEDQTYHGLKCKNCGHEIGEYTLHRIGLKL